MTQPGWLNKSFYPFNSHWTTIDGNQIHYVDEGSGPVMLFVHGTPEWSFGYRDLIKSLRQNFRCIAIDLLGFGLSQKPEGADYTVPEHAMRLEKFITALDLKNICLVANDFGGGIGLSYAIIHPENVNRIVLFNTWMWSLKDDPHYSRPSRMMNSWLGRLLYLQFNFPVNVIMPASFGDKRKLTKAIHAHYKNALATPAERAAAYTFSQELIRASEWWQSLWEKTSAIADKPMLIFWGMKDSFILPSELEKWKLKFPTAQIVSFQDAGHFVQEEKSEEMTRDILAFAK